MLATIRGGRTAEVYHISRIGSVKSPRESGVYCLIHEQKWTRPES